MIFDLWPISKREASYWTRIQGRKRRSLGLTCVIGLDPDPKWKVDITDRSLVEVDGCDIQDPIDAPKVPFLESYCAEGGTFV